MQTGLSPLSLRFTYSIFSFGYHWTSSSGDTEFKKNIIPFSFHTNDTDFAKMWDPYPNTHTCSNQNQFKVLMISLNFSWGFVHFHWDYSNKRPTGIKSHMSTITHKQNCQEFFFLYAFHYLVSGLKKSKHINDGLWNVWFWRKTLRYEFKTNAWKMTSNQKFIRQEIPREAKLPVHKLLQCRC